LTVPGITQQERSRCWEQGGLKGSPARAKPTTKKERSEAAKKAAKAKA